VKTSLIRIKLPSRYEKWRLYFLSDIHLGSKACDETQLRTDIKVMALDPLAWVIIGGDTFEAIMPDDPRWEINLHQIEKGMFDKWVARAANILDPLKGKILAGITGNHEDNLEKRHFKDLSEDLYERLKVPYLGYSGLTRIHCDSGYRNSYDLSVFIHHGSGGGTKDGGKLNRIEDVPTGFEADIYAMCHVHSSISVVRPVISVNRSGRMVSRDRAFLIGGTYYKTFMDGSTTYGEKKMYRPATIGCPYITIYQDSDKQVRFLA
jgi:hypothetical protein